MRLLRRLATGLPFLLIFGCRDVNERLADEPLVASSSSSKRTVFDPNRFILTDDDSSNVNAYWMARFSDLAYESFSTLKGELYKIQADGELTFFEDDATDTQGFVLGTATHLIVVFRGSSNAADALTDISLAKERTEFGWVHRGVHEAFRNVWWGANLTSLDDDEETDRREGLLDFLKRRRGGKGQRKILVAGHSLGGALATVASVYLAFGGCVLTEGADQGPEIADPEELEGCRTTMTPAGVYTFGSPRVGDTRFARTSALVLAGQRGVHKRFVRGGDAVPTLPPGTFWHPAISPETQQDDFLVRLAGREDMAGAWNFVDHAISGYVAAAQSEIGPVLLDEPLSGRAAKAQRFADAYTKELEKKDFRDISPDALSQDIRALYMKKQREVAGVSNAWITAQKVDIDGEDVSVITVWRDLPRDRTLDVAILCNDKGPIVVVGREDDRTFVLSADGL